MPLTRCIQMHTPSPWEGFADSSSDSAPPPFLQWCTAILIHPLGGGGTDVRGTRPPKKPPVRSPVHMDLKSIPAGQCLRTASPDHQLASHPTSVCRNPATRFLGLSVVGPIKKEPSHSSKTARWGRGTGAVRGLWPAVVRCV